MFSGCQSEGTTHGSGEIDHANVFVGGVDPVDVEETRGNQGPGSGFRGGWAFTKELDFQTAFLACLPQGRLFWVFVQFDVSAKGKPFAQLPVEDDQHLSVLDDEDGDSEIDFLVEVRHGTVRGLSVQGIARRCAPTVRSGADLRQP